MVLATNCDSNCSSCGEDCPSRKEKQSFLKPQNKNSNVKKVIAVVSGKGGVGKSLVTALCAVGMKNRGKSVAVLDADVTGPSVPAEFGVHGRALSDGESLFPAVSKGGIQIMSMNMLLDSESDPVVWRGPVIAGVVGQFWTDVAWGDVDYMFVDMPPGTGDVPLTIFQSLPVDGIIVVTSPQEMVSVIVEKAVKMAAMMNKPVLAICENMSWFKCPNCGEKHRIFGKSSVRELAGKYGVSCVAELPMDPSFAAKVDAGEVESIDCGELKEVLDKLANL